MLDNLAACVNCVHCKALRLNDMQLRLRLRSEAVMGHSQMQVITCCCNYSQQTHTFYNKGPVYAVGMCVCIYTLSLSLSLFHFVYK